MRVKNDTDIGITVSAGTRASRAYASKSGRTDGIKAGRAGSAKKSGKSFFAGNMHADKNSLDARIEQKRKQARKEIKKIIGDVWESDKKLDSDINGLKDEAAALMAENKENKDIVKGFEEQRAALKEQYKVEDGSDEQKELELLIKNEDPIEKFKLSKDELDKLSEIYARGLTDYQAASLEIYKYEEPKKQEIVENDKKIAGNYAAAREAKIERLKSDPMLEAQDAAEKIAEAAGKEIIGMLKQDAKEHIDEEFNKRLEEAKERAEKKEEKEELKKEREEKKEEAEERIEALSEKLSEETAAVSDVQKDVQEILDKLKLLGEDIKGSSVDTNI